MTDTKSCLLTEAEAALIDFVRNPPAGQHQIVLRWYGAWTVEKIDFDTDKTERFGGGETFDEAMTEVLGSPVNHLKLHRTVG